MTEGFKDKAGSALLGELIVLLAQNEGVRRALSELPEADSDRILRDVVAGVQKLLHSVRPVSYGARTPTPDQATAPVPGPAVTVLQSPSVPVPAERPKTLQDLLIGTQVPPPAPAVPPASVPRASARRADRSQPAASGAIPPVPIPPPASASPSAVPVPAASAPSASKQRTDDLRPTESKAVPPVSGPATSGRLTGVPQPADRGAIPPVPAPPVATQRVELSQPADRGPIPPVPAPPVATQRAALPQPAGRGAIPPVPGPPEATQRAALSQPADRGPIPPMPGPPAVAERGDVPPRPDGSPAGWGVPLASAPAPAAALPTVSVPPAAAKLAEISEPVPPPAVRYEDPPPPAVTAGDTIQPDGGMSGSMVLPGLSKAEEKQEERTPCTFEDELAYVHAVALIPFTESPSMDPFLLPESGLQDDRRVMVVDLAGLRFYLSLIRADLPSVSKSGLLLLSKQDALRMRYDHERVLNTLRLRGSLLPAEFGTVVHGRDGLLRRAESRHSALLELVVQLSSIERWDLTVSVLDARLAGTLTGGAGTLRGSGREAGRSRGTRSGKGLDVKTLERLLNREKKLAQSILESIAGAAERHAVEFQISLGGGMSDDWKPILRAGFTVSPANMPRFHQAIVEVQNLHPLEEPMLHLAGTTESFSLSM